MSRPVNRPHHAAEARPVGLLRRLARFAPVLSAGAAEPGRRYPDAGFAASLAEIAAARSLWNAPRYWLS